MFGGLFFKARTEKTILWCRSGKQGVPLLEDCGGAQYIYLEYDKEEFVRVTVERTEVKDESKRLMAIVHKDGLILQAQYDPPPFAGLGE